MVRWSDTGTINPSSPENQREFQGDEDGAVTW
jgi:hypothetical protein